MSVATELSRIQANRNTIRAKLVELGMATSVDKLDALGGSIDGLTTTSVSIPAGYTTGGTVSMTSDIEDSLAAI